MKAKPNLFEEKGTVVVADTSAAPWLTIPVPEGMLVGFGLDDLESTLSELFGLSGLFGGLGEQKKQKVLVISNSCRDCAPGVLELLAQAKDEKPSPVRVSKALELLMDHQGVRVKPVDLDVVLDKFVPTEKAVLPNTGIVTPKWYLLQDMSSIIWAQNVFGDVVPLSNEQFKTCFRLPDGTAVTSDMISTVDVAEIHKLIFAAARIELEPFPKKEASKAAAAV